MKRAGLLIVATLLGFVVASLVRAAQVKEQSWRPPVWRMVVVRDPAFRAELEICQTRLDAITEVIKVIENRRGNAPPRTLAEQRRYRMGFDADQPEKTETPESRPQTSDPVREGSLTTDR